MRKHATFSFFHGSLCYFKVQVGLTMACSFFPSQLLLGNVSISKVRRESAALTSAGRAPHLLLCACIAARQGDTNEKRAISQSSDCETLCSRRARREAVTREGRQHARSAAARLKGKEESPEGEVLLLGLHCALSARIFASPGTCCVSHSRVWVQTKVFEGNQGQK